MNYTDTSWLRDTSDNVYITHVNTLGIGVKYNDLSFNNKLDVSGNSYFRNNLIVDNSLIVQDLDIYEKLIDLSNNGGGDVTQQELATKQDVLTAGTNITITGNTISSTGGGGSYPSNATFNSIDVDTGDITTLTNSKITSTDKIIINNGSPTLYFKDTTANQRSGMIHMNNSKMFFLSGAPGSEAWSQVNGEWSLILHTDTNRAQFGGIISAPNQVRFKASRTSSTTINTNVTLPFNKTLENVGGGYSNTTYTFTAPITGTYYFYAQVFTSGDNKFRADFLSGSTLIQRISREGPRSGSGGNTTFTGSFHYTLNQGQTMYMKRADGIVNLPVDPYCQFGGYLLG